MGCVFTAEDAQLVKRSAVSNDVSCGLYRLVTAYREHGHRKADIDLLQLKKPECVYDAIYCCIVP